MDSADFYRAFEDRYRGSREDISHRLEVYWPVVRALQEAGRTPDVLDLGCGRGEWLELLHRRGIEGRGVDLDSGMLRACVEGGLDAVKADACEYLAAQADASWDLITAFHFVEHIPFEQLQALVRQARRVLRPGGVLIMETPNSENVAVGVSRFYTDPTHTQPIPANLLRFLPEYHGFSRAAAIGLQSPSGLPERDRIGLHDVLFDVSPDYAVIAQASGDGPLHDALDEWFSENRGIWLHDMAARFDQRLQHIAAGAEAAREREGKLQDRLLELQARASRAEAKRETAEERLNERNDELLQARRELTLKGERLNEQMQRITELEHANQRLESRGSELERKVNITSRQLESARADLQTLRQSTSWRITGPLRVLMRGLRAPGGVIRRAVSKLRRIMHAMLRRGVRWLWQRPQLALRLQRLLRGWPALHDRAMGYARRSLHGGETGPAEAAPAAGMRKGRHLGDNAERFYDALRNGGQEHG